jgi:hypothetical protein
VVGKHIDLRVAGWFDLRVLPPFRGVRPKRRASRAVAQLARRRSRHVLDDIERRRIVDMLDIGHLLDRRPGWGAGQRNFTSVHLDALSDGAMRELLSGVTKDLPDDLVYEMARVFWDNHAEFVDVSPIWRDARLEDALRAVRREQLQTDLEPPHVSLQRLGQCYGLIQARHVQRGDDGVAVTRLDRHVARRSGCRNRYNCTVIQSGSRSWDERNSLVDVNTIQPVFATGRSSRSSYAHSRQ